jgi:NAD(P)-dependent dehydrogenase (short-subunit alcohol dehydrogenase family)
MLTSRGIGRGSGRTRLTTMDRGVVVITGGSRGIGADVALRAAAAGWAVCLTYLSDDSAAAGVVAEIEAAGGRALAVRADVGVEADVVAAFAAADSLGPVTALVANAGIVDVKARVDEMTAARIERMMAVNVVGLLICCREAVQRMSSLHGGGGGSIVLISSAAARLGSAGQYVDYAASKGAVDTIGVGLAREVVREGIRVNVVRPGIVDTEIHASGGQPDRVAQVSADMPMGRVARVDEVSPAVMWFLSDESSYCTASILDVAGGR